MSIGWDWLEQTPAPAEPEELPRLFADCFRGAGGEKVLSHLRRAFLLRRLPPAASDAELRHLEGQRTVVAYLIEMIERDKR